MLIERVRRCRVADRDFKAKTKQGPSLSLNIMRVK